jgi:hypothetical protein
MAYQRTTSRLVPWIPGPSLDSPEGKLALRNTAGAASSSSVVSVAATAGKRRQSVSKRD